MQLRDGAVLDALQLDDQARLPSPAPFDLALASFEEQRRTGAESIIEVCQGDYLHSAFGTVGSDHLADSDHEGEPPSCSRRSRGDECASD